MTDHQRHIAWAGSMGLLILAFAVGGWLRQPPPRLLESHVRLPENHAVVLGDSILADCQFETSWRRPPTGSLRLELPEGVGLAPGARPRFHTVGWGVTRWRLFLELRAYRPGPMAAGTVEVPCGETSLVVPLPAFTVVSPDLDSPVPEAAPLPPPPPPARWLGWVLVTAIALFIWRFRKRPGQAVATPEEKAVVPSRATLLAALQARVEAPDAALFGELCDLVADHLHACHGVPAMGLTLREQAAWLSQTQALPARVAEPLMQLWQTAEQVRFAGQPPTGKQAQAAYRATETLLARERGGQP